MKRPYCGTGFRLLTANVAALLFAVAAADACPRYIDPDPTRARQADAVVVGYVTKNDRKPGGSRLTVQIHQTIAGSAPSTATIWWNQMMNNGPPERFRGGYVFALMKLPPSRSADSDAFAVMQGICSGAVVFRRGSDEANAIREMFGLWPEPLEVPIKTPLDWLREAATSWPTLLAYVLLAMAAGSTALIWLWPRKRKPDAWKS